MNNTSMRYKSTNVEDDEQNHQKFINLDVANHNKYLKCNLHNVNELIETRKKLLNEERIELRCTLSVAEWKDNLKLAEVTKVARKLTKNFSHSFNKKLYLYPEECLFLLEMKCLLLEENGKKFSIQSAYNTLLAENSGCTFEQYRTYAFLLKLGFRVFRHDKDLFNRNKIEYGPQNLIIIRELPWSKKKLTCNNIPVSKNSNFYRKLFPKHKNGWINLHKPPSKYLPSGLQPYYNTYSFNLCQKSNQLRIIEMISKSKNEDIQQLNTLNNLNNSLQSKVDNYQLKYEENKPSSLLPKKEGCNNKSVPLILLDSECNSVKRKVVINDNLQGDIKRIKSQSNNNKPVLFINNRDYSHGSLSNFSQKEFIEVKSKLSCPLLVNQGSNTKQDLPDLIAKKLYAVKQKINEKGSETNKINQHEFHFDVYYPEHDFPKTNKPLPDFRVAIFSFEDYIPNMFQINYSCEFNNVPVLWAVVHSDSVSFYHLNNIVLPKPNEWELQDT
ncbi:uncharacterized protein LOC126904851 isoform X2 [Daktulosphaira vitifoliae]|uniref:uncharacterized protein LOC126904851 isoform X2 n=1 Tax=Daktulosphaira vitifoliae TaxID=58002 RepID=UPI0021AA0CFC|nr:uncharacterized protein LOC126904851 isoform X2 [Daktulosphaira vitifoliae]